jgi:heme-degrading monooxygenase HmoA
MVLIVFRSRMKSDADEAEAEALGARMYELVNGMPGFVSYSDYTAADGEYVTIVEFESHETLAAWRDHPEHVAAQKTGRERFFESYRITVADVVRNYEFKR